VIRSVRPDGTIETGGVFVPIYRRRVIERIASAAMQRVVLVIAPAGYGKSVALRQYLDGLTDPHVRYDVMADNAGLLGFLRGFSDALSEIAPDARTTLPGAYETNAGSTSPGSDLALWMHAHLAAFRGVIAIDDLHVAQEDREVARFVTSLIDRTRGNVQWIVASRSTSGLPIGTWLAYGDSDLAIDEHELRFSIEEARDAARSFKLGVRDEELNDLLRLTDGWPTALTFALRSSTRSIDLRSISSMTRDMIYHYLAEQVYQTLSEEEQRFVETAALLPEIDLDVMTTAGFDRARAMIEDLRGRVAFISELEQGRYRLHDLFREFARHQVDLRGTETRRELSAKLGSILEATARPAQALRLYVDAGSADDALRLLESTGIPLFDTGYADDLESILSASLGDAFSRDPIVGGLRGLVDLARGRYDEGERKIARAMHTIENIELRAELTLRLAVQTNNRRKNSTEILAPLLALPEIPARIRGACEALLARSRAQTGEVDEARRLVAAAELRRVELTNDEDLARFALHVGAAFESLGDTAEARRYLAEAAQLSSQYGLWSIAARANRNLSVMTFFVEGDTAQGLFYAQQAAAAATRAGDHAELQSALVAILSLETRRGSAERAEQVEKQLAELGSADPLLQGTYLASSRAHRKAWQRNYAEAHRLFASIIDRQPHLPDRVLVRACCALTLALDGRKKESASLVTSTIDLLAGEPQSTTPYAASSVALDFTESLLVLTEIVSGRHTLAARLLKRPQHGDHPASGSMREAAEILARAAKSPSYVAEGLPERIDTIRDSGLGAYAYYLESVAAHLEGAHVPDLAVTLTPQELSVLRLLASGLTPKQIAAETGRSVYTVQTHIQNLIEKFGCHGRAEAIAAARRMGLLEPA
jgi:DNA-binding NarL/FixJ family response regulator